VHDISKLISEPCKCGASTLRKIAPVTRRREAIVKIGDDEVCPSLFDELLFSIPDIIDYQLTISAEGNKDALSFKIEAFQNDETFRWTIRESLLNHSLIKKNIDAGVLTLSQIELAGPGTLTRMTRAKKLIMDKRGAVTGS
jgi:phenylacetate-CoA ligase